MAFTPDGMFYLSKEDYAPSMDILGGAARGMLGLQNKEEAVNAILQGADYDTPEGRRAALEKIRAIDPQAYYKYSAMNQKYETEELGLKSKYGEPALKRAWKDLEAPTYTANWAVNNLSFYKLDDAIEAVGMPKDEAGITNILVWLAENDDSLPSGKAGMLKASYLSMLKDAKTNYMDLNKYNSPRSSKAKQTRDLSSIKGRGERVVTPSAAEATAPVQQYRIERRMGKDVRVPFTPAPVYDVQQKLLEQEQEVLSNMPGM